MKENVFYEEQKYTQWWLWIMLFTLLIIPVYGFMRLYFNSDQLIDPQLSLIGLIIVTTLILSLIIFFSSIRLRTRIDDQGVHLAFKPFVSKTIPWENIAETQTLDYGYVGGWGMRFTRKYDVVFNIKGNKGMLITLVNGSKIVIGSQKQPELEKVLQTIPQSK